MRSRIGCQDRSFWQSRQHEMIAEKPALLRMLEGVAVGEPADGELGIDPQQGLGGFVRLVELAAGGEARRQEAQVGGEARIERRRPAGPLYSLVVLARCVGS